MWYMLLIQSDKMGEMGFKIAVGHAQKSVLTPYNCSDRMMLYIYSDVMVGDYVLSAGRATDSGPGLHSNLMWSL